MVFLLGCDSYKESHLAFLIAMFMLMSCLRKDLRLFAFMDYYCIVHGKWRSMVVLWVCEHGEAMETNFCANWCTHIPPFVVSKVCWNMMQDNGWWNLKVLLIFGLLFSHLLQMGNNRTKTKRLFAIERKRVVEKKRRMGALKNAKKFVIRERFGVFDSQLWFHLNIWDHQMWFWPSISFNSLLDKKLRQ